MSAGLFQASTVPDYAFFSIPATAVYYLHTTVEPVALAVLGYCHYNLSSVIFSNLLITPDVFFFCKFQHWVESADRTMRY